MFERLVKATTPFGLSVVAIAGLTLVGRVPVVDRVILGYVTIAVAVVLAIVHVTEEVRQSRSIQKQPKRKD